MMGIKNKFFICDAALSILYVFFLALNSIHLPPFIDEKNILSNVVHFAVERTCIPQYVNYPTFSGYFFALPVYLACLLSSWLRGYPFDGFADSAFLKFIFYQDRFLVFDVARGMSMILSGVILFTIMRQARKEGVACVVTTVLILILDPWERYFVLSRYALPDILVTFLIVTVFFLCLRYANTKEPRVLLLAAFLAGLAVSAKLNAFMAIFLFLPLPFYSQEKNRISFAGMVVFMAALGFIVGSPPIVFAPAVYRQGFMEETHILFNASSESWEKSRWIWLAYRLWAKDVFLFLGVTSGLVYALYKRTKLDVLLLFITFPSIVFLGGMDKRSLDYFLFLFPLMALQTGRLVQWAAQIPLRTPVKLVFRLAWILILLTWGVKMSFRISDNLRPDNRAISRAWIESHIPQGTKIILEWFYVPSLADQNILQRCYQNTADKFKVYIKKALEAGVHYDVLQITSMPCNIHDFPLFQDARYLVVSSWGYDRFLTSGSSNIGDEVMISKKEFQERACFYKSLFGGAYPYRLIKEFSSGTGPKVKIFENASGM